MINTHLQYFVSDAQSAIFVGASFGMHSANEHTHFGAVSVAGEANAESGEAFVQVHQQCRPIDIAVFSLNFFCKQTKPLVKQTVATFAFMRSRQKRH